jgi:hypothetical protein
VVVVMLAPVRVDGAAVLSSLPAYVRKAGRTTTGW